MPNYKFLEGLKFLGIRGGFVLDCDQTTLELLVMAKMFWNKRKLSCQDFPHAIQIAIVNATAYCLL